MLKADVVIVGSGPVGAAAAQALVEAGVDVLLLEAGAPPEEDRFAVMERAIAGQIPWEFPTYPYEMNGDDVELNVFAIRRLGGSSLSWGAVAPRFHAHDFELRTRYGVGLDWPIRYAELEPWYCRAERFLGVSGADDNPWGSPRSEPFPMPAFPMSEADTLVKEAAARLGIQFHSVPVARNSVPYDGRSACVYYGTCRACPVGAMYNADRTIDRLKLRRNFRVVTPAEAVRVEVGRDGAAERVIYLDSDRVESAAVGGRIILAVQPVETVRLLLCSAGGRWPSGLANNNGWLGRGFVEHAKFYVTGRVRQSLDPFVRGFETAATHQLHDHPHRDSYAGGRIMVRESAGPSPMQVAVESGRWGEALRSEIREIFGHYVTLGAFCEQLVREENRITLSKDVRMPNGDPAARVDFELVSEYEDLGFRKMRDVIFSILNELAAEDVGVGMTPSNSGHYMGGHRMGDDPATSTTDSFLETHEVKGLYLAGGGAFPTSGISNPTLTSVALVLRAVHRMLGR